ncbi:MAG: hypothetical protein ACOC1F_00750 [Myxococcota bacterium]
MNEPALVLGAIVIPGDAEARRPRVICTFSWADNPTLNVKHGRKARATGGSVAS